MKYCGFEVWNVHRKNGTARPASEWVIVENAHAAIITEDEARAIVAARRQRSHKRRFDRGYSRSRKSRYLLSGGLFKCQRCGANMTGFKTGSGPYYVCGSSPYRRGMGCGPGVYVPQDWVEGEMLEGLGSLMQVCSDEDGFVRKVNEELSKLWQESSGYDPQAKGKIKQVDTKIANIRRAIEDGVRDATWANQRLGELQSERQELAQKTVACGEPPQIDAKTAMAYRRKTKKLLKRGTPQERKQLVRTWVQEVKLAPDDLEVEITYRVPEPVMHCLVAGARYTAEKKTPSRIIDFDFERRRVRVSAGTPSELPVTRLAA